MTEGVRCMVGERSHWENVVDVAACWLLCIYNDQSSSWCVVDRRRSCNQWVVDDGQGNQTYSLSDAGVHATPHRSAVKTCRKSLAPSIDWWRLAIYKSAEHVCAVDMTAVTRCTTGWLLQQLIDWHYVITHARTGRFVFALPAQHIDNCLWTICWIDSYYVRLPSALCQLQRGVFAPLSRLSWRLMAIRHVCHFCYFASVYQHFNRVYSTWWGIITASPSFKRRNLNQYTVYLQENFKQYNRKNAESAYLSVCPSVRPLRSGTRWKLLNISS